MNSYNLGWDEAKHQKEESVTQKILNATHLKHWCRGELREANHNSSITVCPYTCISYEI